MLSWRKINCLWETEDRHKREKECRKKVRDGHPDFDVDKILENFR